MLLWLPFAACSNTEPLALSLRQNEPQLRPVHATLYSNIREPRRLLIRDAESWAAAWTEMISAGDPRTPPFVDFTREDVVVAALGEQRAGGYSIAVTNIRTDGAVTQLTVTTTVPGAGCDGAEIITAPLDAVRVPRIVGTVIFDEQNVVRACN